MSASGRRFRPETMVAIEAVKRGLAISRRGLGAAAVTAKGERDLVTDTDLAVEDAVRRIVGEGSGLAVIGEERGGEASADGAPYWLVDPLCGTRNFASGVPLYCVNVALVEDGEISLAVVGDPSTGYVAAGRIAAYAVFWVSALHAGAGALLISEAGGTVSDIDGCAWTIESDSLVGSANGRLHDEILALARAGG